MPLFLLNPWVIGATLAFFVGGQYYLDPKGSVIDDDIIGPVFIPEPKEDWFSYLDSGFSGEKKGLLGLGVLAVILYSKPWK
jgi:hypothetical protein